MLRVLLAALHLIALGIGLGAVLTRGSALRGKIDAHAVKLALRYDTVWGVAAFLWLSTGLWRLLGSVEKETSYYFGNHLFLTKLGLFVLVVIIEIRPMLTLMRWRKQLAAGTAAESVATPLDAKMIAMASHIEATAVVVMVFLAVAAARGFGAT